MRQSGLRGMLIKGKEMNQDKVSKNIIKLVKEAKNASRVLSLVETSEKNLALEKMAGALKSNVNFLIEENKKDLKEAGKKNYSKALIARLTLAEKVINEMAQCLLETARLKDPAGEILETFERPNGLIIKKVRTPIGVIGIIYESRPNVTSDCAGLCLKSGNAVILKGGREAIHSNRAIFSVLKNALQSTKIPVGALQFVDSTDRQAVNILLKQDQYVDLIIPRGGEDLIRFVVGHSVIPVVKQSKGVCHTYVSQTANLDMARAICLNAKAQKPAVCNAMETLLVNRQVAAQFLPRMIEDFQKAGVEIRGDSATRQIVKGCVKKAVEKDWTTEYLDLILSIKVVGGVKEAIDHINTFGSHHSETIVTEDKEEAEEFLKSIDSACLYVNASTRFTDGYQFGFGAEVGISTDKLHARGPMGLEELTTYKYLVYGNGQVRE